MNTDKAKIHLAVTFIGYFLLFLGFYLALMRIDTFLRLRAFDDCGKLSRYETTEKTAHFSYPVLDIYNSCLKDKGINK